MLVVTIDLDWAPELAIIETLDILQGQGITPTVFATHRSPCIEDCMNDIEVGLHPFFHPESSHGGTIDEVVETVLSIPHNIPAFRCHRFGSCNESKKALVAAGMKFSSNTCTDMDYVPPFRDRFGLTEIPIFLEDGGFLWNKRPLSIGPSLRNSLNSSLPHVILIHPMHFAINTPHFDYMVDLKKTLSRQEWRSLTHKEIKDLQWKGRGIRDFMLELFQYEKSFKTLLESLATPSITSTAIAKS